MRKLGLIGGMSWLSTRSYYERINKLVQGRVSERSSAPLLIEKSLRQSVWNQAAVTPATVDRFWEMLRYPGNRQATLDRFGAGWFTFTPQQLAALHMPVLIMWGAHDTLIGAESAQWFNRALPGSTLIVYPDSGHLPMQEIPQRSADDLARWLAAQGAPPAPG